jgi:hypothetical protein
MTAVNRGIIPKFGHYSLEATAGLGPKPRSISIEEFKVATIARNYFVFALRDDMLDGMNRIAARGFRRAGGII